MTVTRASRINRAEAERRDAEVAAAYLSGQTMDAIARSQGITRQAIHKVIKRVRERWRASAIRDWDEVQAEQLAKIDLAESEAWAQWERSKQQRVKEEAERTRGRGPQVGEKTKITREPGLGDTRYLDIVMRCVERRCKLLGIDAPTKIAPTTPDGNSEYAGGGLAGLLAMARDDGHREHP